MFTCVFRRYVAFRLVDRYPNFSEAADGVGGQLHGGKEYPFGGVTSSGRVWTKVPESEARGHSERSGY